MPEDADSECDRTEAGHSTGPRTPEGKERASRNAHKHGMRSAKLILEDERQEQYDCLREGWAAEYQPDTFRAHRLLAQVVLNDWLLQRAERRVVAAESATAEDAGWDGLEWTDEQHRRVQLMHRYKTTAERAFGRAYGALEDLRKERVKGLKDYQRTRGQVQERAAKEQAKKDAAKAAIETEARREAARRARDEERKADRAAEKHREEVLSLEREARAEARRLDMAEEQRAERDQKAEERRIDREERDEERRFEAQLRREEAAALGQARAGVREQKSEDLKAASAAKAEAAALKKAERERARAEAKIAREQVRAKAKVERVRQKESGEKTPAQELFQGQRHKKKRGAVNSISQWIEVTVADGKTVTKIYPSAEQTIKAGQEMWPAPLLVYRRFNFVGCVPPEYHWATSDPVRRANGGGGIQRMTADAWLKQVEIEKRDGVEHLGPVGPGNLPRPTERGDCECPVCLGNQGLTERWRNGDMLLPEG